MSTVYTGGTFDLFHEGHVEMLEACARMAGPNGLVVVGLNTDEFVTRYKGTPPLMDYRQRALLLLSCRHVDVVVPNTGEEDSKITIEMLESTVWNSEEPEDHETRWVGLPDIVAIGDDWACRDYYKQMGFTKQWLDEKRIVLVYVDRRTGESTTSIKQRLTSSPADPGP